MQPMQRLTRKCNVSSCLCTDDGEGYVKYVDQSGKVISTARSTNGYVGSKIPDGAMTIAGYTLVGPDANSDADGLFDADLDSVITYVYKPQYQAANLVVDSASPISANSAVESASGVRVDHWHFSFGGFTTCEDWLHVRRLRSKG